MPGFYRKNLTTTMNDALDEMLDCKSSDQFSLLDELALCRIHAATFVEQYSEAVELCENNPECDKSKQLKDVTGLQMVEALNNVKEMADKASKVHFAGKDHFTALDIRLVVNQFVKLMYETCGTQNQHIAMEFEKLVEDRIRLPQLENQGTSITPDQDVIEMDETIPLTE